MKQLIFATCLLCVFLAPSAVHSLQLESYEDVLRNSQSPSPSPPPVHQKYKKGEIKEDNYLNAKPELMEGVDGATAPGTPVRDTKMREFERERRFNQDQEAKERDFRRAYPKEPVPPRDAYKTYEGGRPPRGR